MVAVAVLAGLMAWFDVIGTIVLTAMILAGLAVVVAVPAGRRLEASLWFVAFQPLLCLVYIHLTWVTAWCVLGHQPRAYLDDPDGLGPVVLIPRAMTFFTGMTFPLAPVACVSLFAFRLWRRLGLAPLVVIPCVWVAALFVWYNGSHEVFVWFMD